MEINLTNFRCHDSLRLTFSRNKVIRLAGQSGKGKSTVFNSVRWILYGKLRKITGSKPLARTIGIIETETDDGKEVRIERRTKPGELFIDLEGRNYTGDVAQELIDATFGAEAMWEKIFYISQNARNQFLTATSIVRTKFLCDLVMDDEKTDEYQERIIEITRERSIYLLELQKKIEQAKGALQEYITGNGLSGEEVYSEEVQRDLERDRDATAKKVEILRKNIQKDIENQNIKKTLTNKISSLTSKKKSLEEKLETLDNLVSGNPIYLNFPEMFIKENREETTHIIKRNDEDREIFISLEYDKDDLPEDFKNHNKIYKDQEFARSFFKETGLICSKDVLIDQKFIHENNERIIKNNKLKYEMDKVSKSFIGRSEKSLYDTKSLEKIKTQWTTLGILRKWFRENSLDYSPESITEAQSLLERRNLIIKNNELISAFEKLPEPMAGEFLSNNKKEWISYNKYLNDIKLLKINSNDPKREISGEISKIEENIQAQEQWKIENEKRKLTKQMTGLCKEDQSSIIESSRIVSNDQLTYKCPCCDEILILKDNVLEKFEVGIDDILTENELLVFKKLQEDYLKYLSIKEQLDSLPVYSDELIKKHPFISSPKIIEDFRKRLDLLKKVIIVEKPEYTEKEIEDNNKYHTLLATIDTSLPTKVVTQINISIEYLEDPPLSLKDVEEELDFLRFKEKFKDYDPNLPIVQLKYSNHKYSLLISMIAFLEKRGIDSFEILQGSDYEKLERQEVAYQNSLKILNLKYREDLPKWEEIVVLFKLLDESENIREELDNIRESLKDIESEILKLKFFPNAERNFNICINNLRILENRCRKNSLLERLSLLKNKELEIIAEEEAVQLEIGDYEYLKQTSATVLMNMLSERLESINSSLSDICSNLFDDNMYIHLDVFKELKDKKIKPQVNFSVIYKDMKYDNLAELSGGEFDRVALAVTIAFALQMKCNFVLLDECLSSLDDENRENCLALIKEYLDEKTVIVIDHELSDNSFHEKVSL